ncbi:TraR/DksA family transcriptional regulator [Sinomicrobium weinanense]|uniref:TraR/DksA C4-type zinc finger protein n=1 Tax=Sinomicrobium weinanense TaxID=2842200 RepID=A0A926JRU2_9FLAO|nr:TraR/DksA C4-type zinc finger protein [Sinomicrobium weinanense]MBC9796071.1 TraR/DksA C4-type zinc finger protein [Sinomicrobium weinanense]
MTDPTDKQWMEFLQKQIELTEKQVERYKEMTKPIAPENAIGRVSRMDAINNQSTVKAALRQAEEKLSKLKYVLDKVGDKDFGICVKCKKPIPMGRIMAMPQSTLCVGCAR